MHTTMRLRRKLPVGVGVAIAVLLLTAGQAQAATGSGTFDDGYEIPSEYVTLAQGVECGTFHRINQQSQDDPTVHTLPMSGTFGEPGSDTGTATFTINDDWHANSEGTYLNSNCSTAGAVEGTLHVAFDDWSCANDVDALYERRNNTDYTLDGTVVCDDLDTGTVETISIALEFVGDQILCGSSPRPACNHVNAGTNLDGVYDWTT